MLLGVSIFIMLVGLVSFGKKEKKKDIVNIMVSYGVFYVV